MQLPNNNPPKNAILNLKSLPEASSKLHLNTIYPKIAQGMNESFEETVLAAMGANDLFRMERIQSLWSGYGEIIRYGLVEGSADTVIVKHVKLPYAKSHPRGWNTDFSHQRKIKSYQVETAWYDRWSSECNEACRVPKCFAMEFADDEILIVLEDLDSAGFHLRKTNIDWDSFESCLRWLANFHATFLGKTPNKLWPIGTYWHLETRPDELEQLTDQRLKQAAEKIDQMLSNTKYQTFVHGDAKLANFCFHPNGSVAAVDFQYVGGGCGMKDLAYFVGSCFDDSRCEQFEERILETYFNHLTTALDRLNHDVNQQELESDWRALYPIAWTDFHRFLKGWSPGHWKINDYSERIEQQVLNQLESHT